MKYTVKHCILYESIQEKKKLLSWLKAMIGQFDYRYWYYWNMKWLWTKGTCEWLDKLNKFIGTELGSDLEREEHTYSMLKETNLLYLLNN